MCKICWVCYNSSSLHVITAKKQKFGFYFEKKWVILCLRSDLGTFGPKGPENLGIGPKRVHWTTFCDVGAENGTFEPQKGLKSRGYTTIVARPLQTGNLCKFACSNSKTRFYNSKIFVWINTYVYNIPEFFQILKLSGRL